METRVDRGHNDKDGHVYFIQWKGGGPVKIGWAVDPERRLLELQVASPVLLRLVDSTPGTMKLEGEIQAAAAAFHIRGEWYIACEALRESVVRFSDRTTFLRGLSVGVAGGKIRVCRLCASPANGHDDHIQGVYARTLRAMSQIEAVYGRPPSAYIRNLLEQMEREEAADSRTRDLPTLGGSTRTP